MRYAIGQRILAFLYVFENRIPFMNSIYCPWDTGLQLKEMLAVPMTVVEHHKVPWDQEPDGENKYDGFICVDDTGNRWASQWPHASYGQVSDAADRFFTRIHPEDTDYENLSNVELAVFEDIREVLDRVMLGIRHFSETDNAAYKAALEKHLEELKCLVKERLGADVEFRSWTNLAPDLLHSVLIFKEHSE